MFTLRPYQLEVFRDHSTGILILHWSRQIGKTTTLAAWALDRIVTLPGHTVTVLSNSLRNGSEFIGRASLLTEEPPWDQYEFKISRHDIQTDAAGKLSRILALAANPRTARGFSGDLILDEMAFYEDITGVWDAAEPILSSDPKFLCRIASTGNGRHNLFYRMVQDPRFHVSRVTRTDAWHMGVPILDPFTRAPITPEEARAAALDKDSYDQNYECAFAGESAALLLPEIIQAAEDAAAGFICTGDWPPEMLRFLRERSEQGEPLFAGVDVGRRRDRTVITVVQSEHGLWQVRSFLRLEAMRLPEQQSRLTALLKIPRLVCVSIDMTGLGLGLYEYTQQMFGPNKVRGVNFASSVPAGQLVIPRSISQPRLSAKNPTVRITESMAMNLVRIYEEKKIRHPLDPILLDDLQLPRRTVTPSGQVTISAERDESGHAGHADHFWSLALALDAARQSPARNKIGAQIIRSARHSRGILF